MVWTPSTIQPNGQRFLAYGGTARPQCGSCSDEINGMPKMRCMTRCRDRLTQPGHPTHAGPSIVRDW